MKTYPLKVLLTALVVVFCHYLIISTVRAPLPAEYWIRDFAIVKRYLGATMPSPKIIFIGGSSTLFGIDAAEVQKSLKIPALNFGLHAGLRLEYLLMNARDAAKPGDIVVLSLEPVYYDFYSKTWTTTNLRDALAWDPASLAHLSRAHRLRIYLESSDLSISHDLLDARMEQAFFPSALQARMAALAPESTIIARYLELRGSSKTLQFDVDNLDANGDLLNTARDGRLFTGEPVDVIRPFSISSYAENALIPFLAEMKNRKVRVLFNYAPYLVYGEPGEAWKPAEIHFANDVHRLGGELLEERNVFFFPQTLFLNTNLHLNAKGKEIYTQILIEALRKKLGPGP
jgi:hypothetical protein